MFTSLRAAEPVAAAAAAAADARRWCNVVEGTDACTDDPAEPIVAGC